MYVLIQLYLCYTCCVCIHKKLIIVLFLRASSTLLWTTCTLSPPSCSGSKNTFLSGRTVSSCLQMQEEQNGKRQRYEITGLRSTTYLCMMWNANQLQTDCMQWTMTTVFIYLFRLQIQTSCPIMPVSPKRLWEVSGSWLESSFGYARTWHARLCHIWLYAIVLLYCVISDIAMRSMSFPSCCGWKLLMWW